MFTRVSHLLDSAPAAIRLAPKAKDTDDTGGRGRRYQKGRRIAIVTTRKPRQDAAAMPPSYLGSSMAVVTNILDLEIEQ